LQAPQVDVYLQAEDGEKTRKGDTALILAVRGGKLMESTARLLKNYRTVLFQSMQHTQLMTDYVHTWLAGRLPESIKASLPPFNQRAKGEMLQLRTATVTTEALNVPVFGRKIPAAIIELFTSPEIQELAHELGVRIPQYSLQKFVQGKVHKVRVLVERALQLEDCRRPPNSTAVERLSRFVDAFEKLTPDEIPSLDAWQKFVDAHVLPGWEDRLHFDKLLSIFGFDDEMATRLRYTLHVMTDPKTGEEESISLEQFAFRWLSKAFIGYGVQGCLTDVTNLVFCMARRKQPENVDETEVAKVIRDTGEKILGGNFTGLWIPTHFVQDAETDDLLSWLLLEHVHKKLCTELQVLVQLPKDRDFDCIEREVMTRPMTRGRIWVFRDSESRNQAALRDVFKWKHPELKNPKPEEM